MNDKKVRKSIRTIGFSVISALIFLYAIFSSIYNIIITAITYYKLGIINIKELEINLACLIVALVGVMVRAKLYPAEWSIKVIEEVDEYLDEDSDLDDYGDEE